MGKSKIVVVAAQKGGVGKTTTAATLGHGLAIKGSDVLLVDADPQGQLATILGVEQEPGVFNLLVGDQPLRQVIRRARERLWLVPGNKKTTVAELVLVLQEAQGEPGLLDTLKKSLYSQFNGNPDFIVFDTAPSVGKLQEAALRLSDVVIIPSAVDYLSTEGVTHLVDTLKKLKTQGWTGGILGVLPTFYDEVTRESEANLADLTEGFSDLVLPPIHRATVLRECAALGKTIFETAPKSRATEEYADLVWRVWNEK